MIYNQEDNAMEQLLLKIKDELSLHHGNRAIIIEKAIQNRLTQNLLSYIHDLEISNTYLENRNTTNFIKKL